MDIRAVIDQMLVLLILLIVGVIAAKTGVIDRETNRRLTNFTLIIPQTCMILGSVLNVDLGLTPLKILGVMGAGCAMYGILVVLSFIVPKIYRCKPEDKGVYSFMTIFGNVGFMGFPVVNSIFGGTALFYAALLNIHFNTLAYSLGISLIGNTGEKVKIDWKKLVNPPLIAAALSILIVCFNIRVPEPVAEAVGMLGDMIVPCSMIIIGSSLGNQRFKDIFGDWRAYAFAPVRLFVAPIVLWAVLRLFIHDTVLLGTMTVLGAMPVAAFATMLSIQYGGNEELASRAVFVSTVLSVVTIPFICWLLPL